MTLHFVTWKWQQDKPVHGGGYIAEHVNVMHDMLKRNVTLPFRHVCVTDDPSGINPRVDFHPLWKDLNDKPNICGQHLPSCYRRLRLFDPVMQREMGIKPGERIISIDLDAVIVRNTDHHWKRTERFVGWARRGSVHPTVFNGSMWMFTAGDLEEIWTEFDPNTSPQEANRAGYMGSDQSWLSMKLVRQPYVGGWSPSNVISFSNDIWNKPQRTNLLRQADIIFFHGKHKPWHMEASRRHPWIKEHWRVSTTTPARRVTGAPVRA